LILPNLWLGGQDVLDDLDFFRKNNITCVLSLGPATPSQRIRLAAREHVNLPDVPTADLSVHFPRIVRFISSARHNGHSVYVHCAAGISRSSTSICAYLMAHLNLPFEQTLQFLSQRRPAVCPNDGFQRQLRRYESSKERLLLAQEMLKVPAYTELQRQDLDAVWQALSQRKARGRSVEGGRATPAKQAQAAEQRPARPGSGSVPIDQLARQRALQAVQATAQRQPGSAIRVGDGSQIGDVGLAWLMPRRRSSASTATSLPPSARLGRAKRPVY